MSEIEPVRPDMLTHGASEQHLHSTADKLSPEASVAAQLSGRIRRLFAAFEVVLSGASDRLDAVLAPRETVSHYLWRVLHHHEPRLHRSEDLLDHIRALRATLQQSPQDVRLVNRQEERKKITIGPLQPTRASTELSDRLDTYSTTLERIRFILQGYLLTSRHPLERTLQHVDTAEKMGLLDEPAAKKASLLARGEYEDPIVPYLSHSEFVEKTSK